MSDKKCPRCGLWNTESAIRCDCGYDFVSNSVKESYSAQPSLSFDEIKERGKKVGPVNDIEAKIAKKSQGALMYTIFSATGFAAVICCPLAIVYANQALKLIDENRVGEQYRSKAKTARTLAIVFTALWVVAIICFASVMFGGTS